jgi:hypothetical protein
LDSNENVKVSDVVGGSPSVRRSSLPSNLVVRFNRKLYSSRAGKRYLQKKMYAWKIPKVLETFTDVFCSESVSDEEIYKIVTVPETPISETQKTILKTSVLSDIERVRLALKCAV